LLVVGCWTGSDEINGCAGSQIVKANQEELIGLVELSDEEPAEIEQITPPV